MERASILENRIDKLNKISNICNKAMDVLVTGTILVLSSVAINEKCKLAEIGNAILDNTGANY